MTQLSTKIKIYANREIDFLKDVRLQDNSDGKGVFEGLSTVEQVNSVVFPTKP
jgi:hypothetical protein